MQVEKTGPATPPTKVPINKTPGVCGGDACVGNHRIMVWLLVGYRQDGWSDEKLLANYPTLTQEGLDAAWEYYRDHRAEIEAAMRANEDLDA